LEDISPQEVARLRLEAWRAVGDWLCYAAAEFTPDETTRSYLEHVGSCVRDEGERRFAVKSGFEPAVA